MFPFIYSSLRYEIFWNREEIWGKEEGPRLKSHHTVKSYEFPFAEFLLFHLFEDLHIVL
jgi:hypothetical protein